MGATNHQTQSTGSREISFWKRSYKDIRWKNMEDAQSYRATDIHKMGATSHQTQSTGSGEIIFWKRSYKDIR